jgi:hypothetical protein
MSAFRLYEEIIPIWILLLLGWLVWRMIRRNR